MNKMVRFVPYTTEDTRIFPDARWVSPVVKKDCAKPLLVWLTETTIFGDPPNYRQDKLNCYNPLTANAGLMTENLVLFEAYACTESGNDPLIFH